MHNYPLEKYHFYVHDNRVIAVSTYAGRTVRGVAVCAAEDKFDLERGKRIAAARCNAKIAAKRVQRAWDKYQEALKENDETLRHVMKMADYYKDAQDAWKTAVNDLNGTL